MLIGKAATGTAPASSRYSTRSDLSIWIEAALNGPWGRERQPGIPVAVEEIVADGLAAAAAGAAIVHLHAYDPATGRQRDDWQTYARIIEAIRARSDALVYPTIPLAGSAYADAAGGASPDARFAHVEELARRGLIASPAPVRAAAAEALATGRPLDPARLG